MTIVPTYLFKPYSFRPTVTQLTISAPLITALAELGATRNVFNTFKHLQLVLPVYANKRVIKLFLMKLTCKED